MHEDDHIRPTETELKLALPPKQGARLLGRPAFRAALASTPEERHEVTTYFDTPDPTLARGGFSLRVRRTGGRRVQTLKADGTANSVALRRGEWEWPIEQDGPDLGLLAQLPLDKGAPGGIDGHLQPVSELELELKAGAPGPLYRLALELHAAVPLAVSAESKAARGARLRTGEAPAVH